MPGLFINGGIQLTIDDIRILFFVHLFPVASVVTVGVAHFSILGTASPMVDAVRLTGMKWLVLLTELAALAATTSVILVLLIAQPRVLYSMANDGLVPRLFANVHPVFKVRYCGLLQAPRPPRIRFLYDELHLTEDHSRFSLSFHSRLLPPAP